MLFCKKYLMVLFVSLGILFAGSTAQAQMQYPLCWEVKKKQIKTGRVTHIPDIWTLQLEQGITLKPAGYKIPLITPSGLIKSEQLEAIETKILELLRQKFMNVSVSFLPVHDNKKQRKDRHGRVPADIAYLNQSWAEFIISSGLGVFETQNQLGSCDRNLQIAETFAERQNLGFWHGKTAEKHPIFTTDAKPLLEAKGEDITVRGEVVSVGIYPNRYYLNFGQEWNSDFTVEISAKVGLDLFGGVEYIKDMQGQNVKIRGQLKQKNGPMIEIKKRNQLEIVLSE